MKLAVITAVALITISPPTVQADAYVHWKNALAILEKSAKWELISLNPTPPPGKNPAEKIGYLLTWWSTGNTWYHQCRYLGRTANIDATGRKSLLKALDNGIQEWKGMTKYGSLFALGCIAGSVVFEMQPEVGWDRLIITPGCAFQPRHAIRMEQDGRTIELLICFQCGEIEVIVEGKKKRIRTTNSPKGIFDSALKKASIPLSPR